MNIKYLLPFVALSTLGGCATSLSYDDASSFERSLLARESNLPKAQEYLYTQPVNKKESCKLPTSQDQLNRSNFRAYWDGKCKNGFAFGLGRDIAISDTHHIDEITVHNGSGDNWSQPRVAYDYVNNTIGYAVGGSRFPSVTEFLEKFNSSVKDFSVDQGLRVVDESGKAFSILTSPFKPERFYLNTRTDDSITYRFTDYSTVPAINQNAVLFTAEVVDPRSNMPGGVAIARYANGSVQHFKIVNSRTEPVSISSDYIDHLFTKYQEVLNATSQANVVIQRAQQIEREYLFKACNGKSSIEGLDDAIYTKICSWRDQFKESYETASANYQRKLEDMRQQAATAEQQHQIQQQINLQKQMLWQQQLQTLNQINQSNKSITCNKIGSFTTCR